MSDNWSVIKHEVSTYREYVSKLPKKAAAKASYCYLLSKEEIDRLLGLKGDGTLLHGVRIYLGGEMIDHHLIPTVHVVACEKDGDNYNDYNVPTSMPPVAMATETGVKPLAFAASAKTATASADGGTGDTGKLRPCPNFCSGSNILNS
jgi:hypothetical protein